MPDPETGHTLPDFDNETVRQKPFDRNILNPGRGTQAAFHIGNTHRKAVFPFMQPAKPENHVPGQADVPRHINVPGGEGIARKNRVINPDGALEEQKQHADCDESRDEHAGNFSAKTPEPAEVPLAAGSFRSLWRAFRFLPGNTPAAHIAARLRFGIG